jgi:hypothetical protein
MRAMSTDVMSAYLACVQPIVSTAVSTVSISVFMKYL